MTLARCLGGRVCLAPAVILAKFILILQRDLIFQWCIHFPLYKTFTYLVPSHAENCQTSWVLCTESHPALEADQQHSVRAFLRWLEKPVCYTTVYWLQWSICFSVFLGLCQREENMLNLQSAGSFNQCQNWFTVSYKEPRLYHKKRGSCGAGGMVEEGCSYYEAVLGVGEYRDPGLCHMQWCTGFSPSKAQCLI